MRFCSLQITLYTYVFRDLEPGCMLVPGWVPDLGPMIMTSSHVRDHPRAVVCLLTVRISYMCSTLIISSQSTRSPRRAREKNRPNVLFLRGPVPVRSKKSAFRAGRMSPTTDVRHLRKHTNLTYVWYHKRKKNPTVGRCTCTLTIAPPPPHPILPPQFPLILEVGWLGCSGEYYSRPLHCIGGDWILLAVRCLPFLLITTLDTALFYQVRPWRSSTHTASFLSLESCTVLTAFVGMVKTWICDQEYSCFRCLRSII